MQRKKTKRNKTLARVILRDALGDVFITGLILVVYALFQHVIPIYRARQEAARLRETVVMTPAPVQTAESIPSSAPTPEPDRRTEWQVKFAEHFTDEVVVTENSYTSPNVSVTITTYVDPVYQRQVRWYLADIYVASLDNIATAFANDSYTYYGSQNILEMMEAKNALFAVGGDSCLRQTPCFTVRNGIIYNDGPPTADVCILCNDGTMEILDCNEMDVEALSARTGDKAIYQSWHFGPSLLDADGHALSKFKGAAYSSANINFDHPRAGIGYYEPGHYCAIVVEGRIPESEGVDVADFAKLFERVGCTLAYNLDGGRTSQIAFNGQYFNKPSNGTPAEQNDIIFVTDTAPKGGKEK